MFRSIYDILNKNIDYKKEYKKLKDMLFCEYLIIGAGNESYTYEEVFDSYIVKWKYRGSKSDLSEILAELERTFLSEKNDLLAMLLCFCELILNIKEFLKYVKKNYYGNYDDRFIFVHDFKDEMLLQNVAFLLKEFGYCIHKEEEYKVLLVKNDSETINAAMLVSDINVKDLLMEYNDFRIVNSVINKQKILCELAKYLEPKRKDIKAKNSQLEQNLFMAFNNLNIRHNNLEGKEQFIKGIADKDLIEWYDKTYCLILHAIRLLEIDEVMKSFEELRSSLS